MKKWLLLVLTMLLVGIQLFAAATKVAILPIKRLDRHSEYIRRLLTVRDLGLTFDKHDQYELMDMRTIERAFKELGFDDVDDLQLEELAEIATELKADVLITANVSTRNQRDFILSMRFYSYRTNELKQGSLQVGKEKNARWKTLDDELMSQLDDFISQEFDKVFNIAINFYSSGNYVEAERNLLSVINVNPDKTDAYYYLGATYNKQKKYPQALENLNKVLAVNEKHLQSLRTIVEVHEAMGNNVGRLQALEKIAAIEENEDLWLTIGNIYAELGDIDNAARALRTAIEVNPDFASAQYRLAFLLFDAERWNDAIPYLEFAFEQFPDNDIISTRLATAYQRSNRVNEAITKYELLIQNNPSNVLAYLNLVSLYRIVATSSADPATANTMYTQAIQIMNRLKAIQPENGLVYLNLASIYLAQNNNNEADNNAKLAASKDPGLYQALIIQAMVQQSRGTEKYNQFVDLEKRAAAAVGRTATNLGRERDAARAAAATHFRNADDLLKGARSRTTDPEVVKDLNERITRLAQLLAQATGY